jgi:hypothetical protein
MRDWNAEMRDVVDANEMLLASALIIVAVDTS